MLCIWNFLLSRLFSFVGLWHWVPWNRYCVNTANWSPSFAASSWTGRRADAWNRAVSWRSEFLVAIWVSTCSIRAKTCLRCCAAAPNLLRLTESWMEFTGLFQSIPKLLHESDLIKKCRLSGITSNIQKLRNAFDEDRVPDLHTEDILKDIHSVASLLKMYFRWVI